MHTFNDKFGQVWSLDLDLALVQELENHDFPAHGKIKFFPPSENLLQLLSETSISFGMIWEMCKYQLVGKTYYPRISSLTEEATAQPITNQEHFAMCFNGDTVEQSRIALFEELGNFFPQMRTTLKQLTERYSHLVGLVNRKSAQKMEAELSDEKMETLIDQLFEEKTTQLPPEMQKVLNKLNPLPVG